MTSNTSLLYGFSLDRDYFMDFSMRFQLYATVVAQLWHPIMLYLLIFENKPMKRDIRVFYILTHVKLALIIHGWSFSFAFRIYPLNPYAAFYCEGPICRAGIDKQILTTIFALPGILSCSTFPPLMTRMQQVFVANESWKKLSLRTQLVLIIALNTIQIANVAGYGYFGKDHDDSENLLKEPELAWVAERGGTVFLFGRPGDPQYFKWELRFIVLSIVIIAPFQIFITSDALASLKRSSSHLSSCTQVMARKMCSVFIVQSTGALVCYFSPLAIVLAMTIVDCSFIPGWFFAPLRLALLSLATIDGHQFVILFIAKNPASRKIIARWLKQFLRGYLSVKTQHLKTVRISINVPPENNRCYVCSNFYAHQYRKLSTFKLHLKQYISIIGIE